MKVLIIGAGAVGAVYAHFLQKGGAEVAFWVKPHQVDTLSHGLTLKNLRQLQRPVERLQQTTALYSQLAEVQGQAWDFLVLAIAFSDLKTAADLRELFLALTPRATPVSLCLGLEDRESLFPVSDAWIHGMVPFVSFKSQDNDGDTPSPQTLQAAKASACFHFWIPPLAQAFFSMAGLPHSAQQRAAKAWVHCLRQGGFPARLTAQDVRHKVVIPNAVLLALVLTLEHEGWQLKPALTGLPLARMAQAAREILLLTARKSQMKHFWPGLLQPVLLKGLLRLLCRPLLGFHWLGFDFEGFLVSHFTKIRKQTHQELASLLHYGKTQGIATPALQGFYQPLRPARLLAMWGEPTHPTVELQEDGQVLQLHVSARRTTTLPQPGDWVAFSLNRAGQVQELAQLARCGAAWNPADPVFYARKTATAHLSRYERLTSRARLLQSLRQTLEQDGFLEIEPKTLITHPVVDQAIESLVCGSQFLLTSSEFQIKRLMIAGFPRVFSLAKNFRAEGEDAWHTQEFTMLEWARSWSSLADIERDAQRLIQDAFLKLYPLPPAGSRSSPVPFSYRGQRLDLMAADWPRLTVSESFEKYLNFPPLSDFEIPTLLAACSQAGLNVPEQLIRSTPQAPIAPLNAPLNAPLDPLTDQRGLLVSYLLDQVQPHLGFPQPVFLTEWPAFLTSSAPTLKNRPLLASRSECYLAGVEIADGFPFLTDPHQQKELWLHENQLRLAHQQACVTLDQRYLEDLAQGLPEGAGMALGVDRLLMILTDSDDIANVQSFSSLNSGEI